MRIKITPKDLVIRMALDGGGYTYIDFDSIHWLYEGEHSATVQEMLEKAGDIVKQGIEEDVLVYLAVVVDYQKKTIDVEYAFYRRILG